MGFGACPETGNPVQVSTRPLAARAHPFLRVEPRAGAYARRRQRSSTEAPRRRHSTRSQRGARSQRALPVPLPSWPAHYVRTRALPLAPKPERTSSLRKTAAAVPGTDTGSNAGIDERKAPHIVNFRVRVRQHPVAAAHGCRAQSRFTLTVSGVFEFGIGPDWTVSGVSSETRI